MATDTVTASEAWLDRVGGLSALAFAAAYVAIFPLYATVGAPPSDPEAWLAYGAGKGGAWSAIIGLSVFTDLLLVPIGLALLLALRAVHRDAALVGVAFIGLFVALDLAVTWPNYTALVTLAEANATAATDAQQGADLAGATYATAVVSSPLIGIYSIVTLSVGILVVSLVMLRGGFSRLTATVGVATGVLGIAAVAGPILFDWLGAAIIVASLLTTLWAFLVGLELLRRGRDAT